MRMTKISILALTIVFFFISVTPSFARSGCCSHHGGVSGCGCADGTPLSTTCLPYYPECSNSGGTQQDSTQVPQTQTYTTPIPQATTTPIPTMTLTPTITSKPTNPPTPTVVIPTPTPQPQTNFFSWLFGLFFGQKQQTSVKSYVQKIPSTSTVSSAGIESGNSTCKAVHTNPADPQAYLPD